MGMEHGCSHHTDDVVGAAAAAAAAWAMGQVNNSFHFRVAPVAPNFMRSFGERVRCESV